MKTKIKVISIVLLIIAVIAAGIIYFLFSQSNKVSKAPHFLYAIAGGNTNLLKEPTYAIANEKGTVFVADSGNHRVRIFDNKGTYKADLGGPNSKKPLVYPYGIALLGNGNLIVADIGAGALYEYTVQGEYIKAWLNAGQNYQPAAISVGIDRHIYLTDLAGKQVLVFDQAGKLVKKIKPLITKLDVPLGIISNEDGSVWVADGGNYNVKLLNSNYQVMNVFDGGPKNALSTAKGLAMDKQGRIYVADTMANEVRVFDNQGNDLFSIGKDKQPNLSLPNGLSIDSANRIYIANQGSNQIQVWGWKR